MVNVVIWNEHRHERERPEIGELYPDGIHGALREGLATHDIAAGTATLDEPEHGLPEERLAATDVLLWWGHGAHAEVSEEVVDRVQRRVLDGMGLVVLHSGHHAKIFRRLLGTSCNLSWREAEGGERERVWAINPGHAICAGIGPYIEVPAQEMYGEPFDIPEPDELVFISWFQGGEVFRSGCCFRRGRGKIFYFSPGHETFPIYHQPEIVRVIANGVRWACAPHADGGLLVVENRQEPIEPLTQPG
ncbi:MAG: ThuA domain-containing protein [Pseudomonadota bacterium]